MTAGPRGPTEPLNLRAIEKQHVPGNGKGVIAALLAHARALRAALQEAKGVVGWFAMQREKESSKYYIELEARIAAVLAQATDA